MRFSIIFYIFINPWISQQFKCAHVDELFWLLEGFNIDKQYCFIIGSVSFKFMLGIPLLVIIYSVYIILTFYTFI